MPIEFEHITVPSKGLEASIAFYTALGLTLIDLEPEHHAHFESKEHQVIFTAYYNTKRPDYAVKVYLEVDDVERLEIRFRESVTATTQLKNWHGKELELNDPDGNTVIVYQKLTPQSTPPWQTQKDES